MSSPPEGTLDSKKELEKELNLHYERWRQYRKSNRNWDGRLTVATIVLTLIVTILGVEGITVNQEAKKLAIGICGGLVVAIQSIGNAFPVKQRAGKYRLLEAQALSLKTQVTLSSDDELDKELANIRKQLTELIVKSADELQ